MLVRVFEDMTPSPKPLHYSQTMKHLTQIIFALAGFACASLHAQKFDGLALTPPMGWNS